MIFHRSCLLLATAACTNLAMADSPNRPAPAPDQGKVEPGGRFVPTPPPTPTETKPAAMTREQAEEALRKDLRIEKISATLMRLGEVTLDSAARTVRFRAVVNMTQGQVEYAVVTENGKKHEAVFTTKANPRDIHLAMLLLGVRPHSPASSGAITPPAAASINATVEWETNGPPKKHPLAEFVALTDGSPDQPPARTLANDPWVYTGSAFDASGFVALRDGSIISLIVDPAALLGSPAKERDNDDIHVANSALLPRAGMPVTIVLTCPQATKPSAPPEAGKSPSNP